MARTTKTIGRLHGDDRTYVNLHRSEERYSSKAEYVGRLADIGRQRPPSRPQMCASHQTVPF